MDQLPKHNHTATILSFPQTFLFGTASSAFQVESNESHERLCDWDVFIREHPEKEIIKPGEIGPNWWHEGIAEKDIDLVAQLGTNAMRIGIEWARIEPERGIFNQHALLRYRRIVDHIKQRGMLPMITLQHFTLPIWIAREGGWENERIIHAFASYVQLIASHFADVVYWITINEPMIPLNAGYLTKFFPPERGNLIAMHKAFLHMLEAHHEAFAILKQTIPGSQVGIAHAFRWYRPEHDVLLDKLYTYLINYLENLSFASLTNKTVDFIGCNYYSGYFLHLDFRKLKHTASKTATGVPQTILFGEMKTPGTDISDVGWPIVPHFFLDLLRTLHKKYSKPIIITENGIADADDSHRAFYILTHLVTLWKAMQEGADIQGYMYWSCVDNLEWLDGYRKRFGLIEVNHYSGERNLRPSANLYREIITSKKIDYNYLADMYLSPDEANAAKRIIHGILRS